MIIIHYIYKTSGTCSIQIEFDINNNKLFNVKYTGGCNGNLKAISNLIEGMDIEEIERKCKGITCGIKNTSCIDQLLKAIEEVKSENINLI